MITIGLDVSEVRASPLSRRLEATYAPIVSQVEIRAPARVVATSQDPVEEWLRVGGEGQVSISTITLRLPELEWTSEHEKRFQDLAGHEATSELSTEEKAELERLTRQRRGLKNPRRGEELLWDYEQRQLAQDLIVAFSR